MAFYQDHHWTNGAKVCESHCVTFFISQPGSFFNTYYLSVIWTCMSIIHTFPGEFVGASPPWPADQDELLCAAQIESSETLASIIY